MRCKKKDYSEEEKDSAGRLIQPFQELSITEVEEDATGQTG